MTLTFDIEKEQQQRLQETAERHGLDAGTYAQRLFSQLLEFDSEEAFEADMDALAEGSENLPILAPEATLRSTIYGDGNFVLI